MLCKRSAEFSTKDLTTALLHTKMYAEISAGAEASRFRETVAVFCGRDFAENS